MDALEDAGSNLLEAKDGAEAIKLMDNPDHVDVLVSDINMPGCSGYAVANRLRVLHPNIPVILFSGRPD